MTEITHPQAQAIATMLRLDAFAEANAAKVRTVALGGTLDDDPRHSKTRACLSMPDDPREATR